MAAPINVDAIMDFAGQTISADINGTILNSSTHGTLGSWGVVGSPSAGQFTIQAAQVRRHSAFKVGATVYPAGDLTSQRMVLNSDSSFKYASSSVPGSLRIMTAAGFLKLTPLVDEFKIYDLFRASGVSTGHAYVIQLNTNNGGSPGAANYKVGIEATTGSTLHSTYNAAPQGSWIWASIRFNYNTGATSLSVFETTTWTLLFTVSDVTGPIGENIGDVRLGNGEVGTSGVEIGEWVFNYSNPPAILGP